MPSSNIVQYFENLPLSKLKLSSHVVANSGSEVQNVVAAMAAQRTGCAVVMDGAQIAGILTERDITTKVCRWPDMWEIDVDTFMTPAPRVIYQDDSAIKALRVMNEQRFRNMPVVSGSGDVLGSINHYDLVREASAFLGSGADLGPSPTPEHNLFYVDLSGLQSSDPLMVGAGESLDSTIQAMIDVGTGLASVVNDRGAVIGEFTEHDLFTKVACRVEDLEDQAVGDWMTTEIAASSPSTSIADGLHVMAGLGHRYLVLLSETNRALGVLTFRDLTEYFETLFAG